MRMGRPRGLDAGLVVKQGELGRDGTGPPEKTQKWCRAKIRWLVLMLISSSTPLLH